MSVYDASSAVDPQYLLTYALLIGMIAGIAYLVTKVLGGKVLALLNQPPLLLALSDALCHVEGQALQVDRWSLYSLSG